MKAKAKKRSVPAYHNGKPRTWKSGNWTLRCWGFGHVAADIQCFVEPDDVTSGKRVFLLRCPSAEHCEAIASWLLKAAAFTRKTIKKRTVSQRS
jgi:hypothetical protein